MTGCAFTLRGIPIHHSSRTQTTVALSSGEAELCGLSSGTIKAMEVLQSLRVCNFKTNGCVTMATDSTAGKSMASRLGVSRSTKHIQLHCLYVQDVGGTGVFRNRSVLAKDNFVDLHTKCLPVGRLLYICEYRLSLWPSLLSIFREGRIRGLCEHA